MVKEVKALGLFILIRKMKTPSKKIVRNPEGLAFTLCRDYVNFGGRLKNDQGIMIKG